jgi:hypothetical protein
VDDELEPDVEGDEESVS